MAKLPPRSQHAINASIEKHYMADAARDATYETRRSAALASKGNRVEAAFAAEEAKNAESWVGKRNRILNREERLSK